MKKLLFCAAMMLLSGLQALPVNAAAASQPFVRWSVYSAAAGNENALRAAVAALNTALQNEVLRGGQKLSSKMLGYYSPTFAEDFANLPPAFIYVGGLDLFVNEDIDYAAKLTEANVDTELHVIPGLYHAFEIAAPKAEQSKIFWQRVYAFSKNMLKN